MAEQWYVRIPRGFFALLALGAVGFNFFYHVGGPHFSTANFFSYFTNLSNIAASVLLLGLALAPHAFGSEGRQAWLRGGATVYMATTGVVYALLLDGTSGGSDPSLPWVNTVVHRIMPLVLVLDWLLVRPGNRINYRVTFGWLGFPLLYILYTEVRGAVVHWYPYPFLYPNKAGGAGGVTIYILAIAAGIIAASVLVAWLGNLGRRSAADRAVVLEQPAAPRA